MTNKIFHLDMDCYFASVEMMLNKKLENVPMCVGGRMQHGVVSSANYVARKLGVKSAMPIFEAKKICPSLIVVDAKYELYEDISEKINAFLLTIVKKIEKTSIDEWYIDVSGSEYETWQEIEFALYLKNTIKAKFNLQCSIGNSFTLFLAKTATDLCKPDGFLTLNRNNFKTYLHKIPLSNIIGIGKKTLSILNKEFQIYTIDDVLSVKNEFFLKNRLGISWSRLKFNLLGIETNIISTKSRRKNLGKSYTVKHLSQYDEYVSIIHEIVDGLNYGLIKYDYLFSCVNLKIKLKDNTYISKTKTYNKPIERFDFNDLLVLFDESVNNQLFDQIKNISVTLMNLENKNQFLEQQTIFDTKDKNLTIQEQIAQKANRKLNKKIVMPLSQKKTKF